MPDLKDERPPTYAPRSCTNCRALPVCRVYPQVAAIQAGKAWPSEEFPGKTAKSRLCQFIAEEICEVYTREVKV